MDIEAFQRLQTCIDETNVLLNGIEENKDDIFQCVGEDVAALYGAICDGAAGKLRSVRSDLQLLQQTKMM